MAKKHLANRVKIITESLITITGAATRSTAIAGEDEVNELKDKTRPFVI